MFHKFILWCFRNLDNVGQIFSVACAFFIMTTVLYWLETILSAQWNWLNFIKPALDIILNYANSIFPFKFDAFGTTFDAKFIIALIMLIALMLILRFMVEQLENLKAIYNNAYIDHKLAKEKSLNKKLINNIKKEQNKISKYMVLINTQIKKKFSHQENKVNINEQNKTMNNFLYEKLGVKHLAFNGGFLYCFNEFDKIDNVLDILFKILKSNTPLDYEICIQAGDNLEQLKKLSELQLYNKITMCADTVLRYKCKKSHRYGTYCIGEYQKEDGTIEVHEFQEIL